MLRTFEVTAYHGENNSKHTGRTITCNTPWDAATIFARELGCEIFDVRVEQATSVNDKLFSNWSAGWTGSGQRIYVKEQIGG